MSDFMEEKACNLCGSRAYRTVFFFPAGFYSHDQFETASWDGRQHVDVRIVECKDCGLRFSHPSFREEFLHLIYPPDVIHSSDAIRASFNLEARKPNAILRTAARYSKRGATLLDIGTRYGALPYIARHKYGFDAHGLEFNAASVERGREHFDAISQGTIQDVPDVVKRLGWSTLDVIVMEDVIEHLVDPRRDLLAVSAAQEPGGLLLLRTMDSSGWGARLFGRNWYYYAPAAHMFYFDEHSLGRLLESTGYQPVEVQRTGLAQNGYRTVRSWFHRELKPRLLRRERPASTPARRPSHLLHRQRLDDDLFLMVARRV